MAHLPCASRRSATPAILLALAAAFTSLAAQPRRLESSDLRRLRSVGEVAMSPDASRVVYSIVTQDGPGRPAADLWIMNVADGATHKFCPETQRCTGAVWSPNGEWIAFQSIARVSGRASPRAPAGDQSGLHVAHPDYSGDRFIMATSGTNNPLPTTGNTLAWSPDSKRIAFVSATPGPETADATGDPVVITRYLYKPDAGEGSTRFNDNRRLHIFLWDFTSGSVKQITSGDHYEHSIDWSPNGEEIAFVSNREPNEDQFFNYDLFALRVSDGHMRRITATENAEYRPRWSPDGKTLLYQGTKRGLTDLETTMEDTHVWLINAEGSGRRELGARIDNRQGPPLWSPDGRYVWFTVQERGSVNLYRLPSIGEAEPIVKERGIVGGFSLGRDGSVAYIFTSPSDMAQLYLRTAGGQTRKLTNLNAEVLAGKPIAEVEPFTFISNDNKYEVEAFLTKPLGLTATSQHPLIVNIHGGPHGQQGPAFNARNQVYAARGWAVLMVNYRGSTGYGQAFSDAVFGDQNGNEGQDVIYAVGAALRRYLFLDRDRMGVEGVSYGGQLSAWLVTQTSMFKAAIPIAGITNLVSYNYMTYYNQYEQMEFGIFPHQGNLMDVLWERSALKHVANVKTPVMLQHGENDNDVPIAEAEQFYIALRDVGVEAVMVRYPREGHGLSEPVHQVDSLDRSIAWYEKHFPPASPKSMTDVR
jgi:dipeptidyl aminopeptidase/acylaminoacyl peptidase